MLGSVPKQFTGGFNEDLGVETVGAPLPHLHSAARFVVGLLGSWCMVTVWFGMDCCVGQCVGC